MGEGSGKSVTSDIQGGQVGVIIDCRGRPFVLPEDKTKRIEALNRWAKAIDMYPA